MNFLVQQSVFSNQFKESFASTGISPEIITLLIWILGSSMVILCCGIIFRIVQHKMRPRKQLQTIEDTKKIIKLLGISLTDRSRFEIIFKGTTIKGQGIFCSIISIDNQEIILELPEYVTPRKTWIGRPIDAYFSISSTTKSPTYYTFTSSVLDIGPRNQDGIVPLHIALPQLIRLGQRRMHFRLEPPSELITEMRMWFFPHESRFRDHDGPALWGEPMARFPHDNGPEAVMSQMHIKDISAGGCRVSLLDDRRSSRYLHEEKSPDVFMHLDLNHAEGMGPELYVIGKIRTLFRDPTSKHISLGVQFIMQGVLGNATQKHITWEPIRQDEGLPDVGNWVFKQHLALFRQEEQEHEKEQT